MTGVAEEGGAGGAGGAAKGREAAEEPEEGLGIGRQRVGPVLLAYARSSSPRATGRLLLAELVGELVPGVAPRSDVAFSTVCARCGGDHGPPVAIGLPVSVSVSYAGSLVVVGAVHARDAAALGIDIEAAPPGAQRPMADLAPLFAPGPPPDLRGWTMIEAALKADGRGLRVAPSEVVLGVPAAPGDGAAPPSVLGEAAVLVSVPGRSDLIEVARAGGPVGHVLSVAVVPAAS